MRAKVTKWGNSLGLRLPRAVAQELGIDEEGQVEMEVLQGKLVIAPVRAREYSLEELLSGITPENCHAEMDWGGSTGAEFA